MTVTVNSIRDKLANQILNDASEARWTHEEIIEWVNEAQVVIATAVRDAKITITDISLIAGNRQSAPTDAIRILDIVCAYDGTSARTPIRRVQKQYASLINPTFYSDTAVDSVKEWYYDEGSPRTFEVYPAATTDADVEIVYNAVPSTVAEGGNLDIADHYAPSVVDYTAFRAFSKDTEDVASDLSKATGFYNSFAQSIGLKSIGDEESLPHKVEP